MSVEQDLTAALNALVPRLKSDGVGVADLKRLSGGASQETWAFSVTGPDDSRRDLILRRAPGGHAGERASNAITLPIEAQLIEAARSKGTPAPLVAHVADPEDGLGEAFIMDRVQGETIARKILRDDEFETARERLAGQCGAALAQIHSLDETGLPPLPDSPGLDQLTRYEEIYLSFDSPRPVFDLAASWLKSSPPTPLPSVLVHGDFRLGNLMVDQNGLAAVLDWELAHFGDPREDLAWLCVNSWRFGISKNRVGGFGSLDALLEGYAAAGGVEIAPTDIDWWETLGSLKWGIMCMTMYESFRTGANPSVERAAIGRRVSETEIDLINLLERV